jgi:hypothetical protein
MALPLLCCGIAHSLDVRPAGPAQGMRGLPGSVLGIPRLERKAGSALELVRDCFRLRVAQHCAATQPSRRAAGVQASGGFSGAEKATRDGCSAWLSALQLGLDRRDRPALRNADTFGTQSLDLSRKRITLADGEARAAAASDACGTSGVLAEKGNDRPGGACARADQMRPMP